VKRKLTWLALLLAGWLGAVAGWIAIGPNVTGEESAETAIVLGAAVIGDAPSSVFAARLDHAVALYEAGRVKRILVTGGRSPEDSLSEAAAGAVFAQAQGVPESAVLIEDRSRTTRQNLDNARKVLGEAGQQPVLIVSDPLHMRRAMAMAADAGLDAQPAPTPTSRYRSLGTQLPFLARELWFMHAHWLLGV
jgi:uncharacterized SAM-binding protein YcdF (DUF218 family)